MGRIYSEFPRGFVKILFSILADEHTGILAQFLKSEKDSLMAFEKFCEDIGALFKRGRGLLAAFENSNEIKKLDK